MDMLITECSPKQNSKHRSGISLVGICRLSKADQEGTLCLPLKTYSIAQPTAPGKLLLGAGVILKDGTMVVAQQLFEKGLCINTALARESVKQ